MTGSRVCELIFEAMGEHLGSDFAHAPSKTRRRCYGRRPVDADTRGTGYHQSLSSGQSIEAKYSIKNSVKDSVYAVKGFVGWHAVTLLTEPGSLQDLHFLARMPRCYEDGASRRRSV